MKDPRPLQALLLLQLLAACALAGWWFTLPPLDRLTRLRTVMEREAVPSLPPTPVWQQPGWLVAHRWGRLQGIVGVLTVGLVIGGAEGVGKRKRDVLGGFRLTAWTIGVVGVALLPGLAGAYLVLPWTLPATGVAWGGAGVVGCVGFAVMLGRPYVP